MVQVNAAKSGFSLVELSIVLVILGLLVGGVLAGQSLIRAAELRAVVNEQNQIVTGVRSFRDKYFNLPGDLPNATAFWGADTGCPPNFNQSTAVTANTTPKTATCNGDGDGKVLKSFGTGYTSYDNLRFWQQLANAGLITGQYNGYLTSTNYSDATAITPGINVMPSRVGAWMVDNLNNPSGVNWYFAGDYGNYLMVGAKPFFNGGAGAQWFADASFNGGEAWNIDTKMDDGKPNTGSVRTNYVLSNNASCVSPSQLPTATAYDLTITAKACNLLFPNAF